MARRIRRRDFLELSAMAGAVAGMELSGLHRLAGAELQAALDAWILTCCNVCGGAAGVPARVVNGQLVKIEPNADNPVGVCNIYSDFYTLKSTGARMCPKESAASMSPYDPGRVKKPLKRAGVRGAGLWQKTSYDQAVSEIAVKLAQIRADKPEKLIWFTAAEKLEALHKLELIVSVDTHLSETPLEQYLNDTLCDGIGVGLADLEALPGATRIGEDAQYPTPTYPVNWKEPLHTYSRTTKNRWLMEFHGGNELWININPAQSLGIAGGDLREKAEPNDQLGYYRAALQVAEAILRDDKESAEETPVRVQTEPVARAGRVPGSQAVGNAT